MTNHYDQLISVLREVFQLDRSDLDFGIYRILNQKSEQINEFLTKRLLVEVKDILKQSGSSEFQKLQQESEEKRKTLIDLGVDPETNEKYKELQTQLSKLSSMDSLEQEVYSHLTNFFKRYYKEGDFISLRRYKNDTYAIPYEGEEVKLYRANHDQYYIKTTENLKNYAFYVGPNKEQKVIFRLVEASTEQNNNKSQNNKERRFALYEERPFDEEGDVLIINCTYDLYEKGVTQKSLTEKALEVITTTLPKKFQPVLLASLPTESNRKRTVIEKHFNDFTTKNTFDYFIHKDLEGFLSRELDFYIKNEILHIDDIDTTNETHFLAQLSKIKALKQVASKIITMLAQVENFQKKLREKKKFITNTNYCITLDKIPESYYNEILKNKEQLEEWKKLFNVTIKTIEDLKNDPFLVLDTKFFASEWKDALLAEFENIDEECDGLLINSENRQALNLLQDKYQKQVKYTYVDPPYNAKSSEILYKNTFKHSSRLSFIENRVAVGKTLSTANGVFTMAIDENEEERLSILLSNIYNGFEKTTVTVIHNPGGIQGKNFSYTNEFAIFMYPNDGSVYIGNIKRDTSDITPLRDWGGEESKRETAQNCFYPIYVKNGNIIKIGDVCEDNFHPQSSNVLQEDGLIAIYPIDQDGVERKWRFARQSVEGILEELRCDEIRGILNIRREKVSYRYKTVRDHTKYNSNTYGSKYLGDILGVKAFSFPKSIYTVYDSLHAVTQDDKSSIVLDYFAGSGTTGHAVIKLNREDEGKRKYILVEMGEYFDTVTKPRIQKVVYSDNRKEGKPQDKNGISQIFKYFELESYEDTLNNLVLQKTDKQQALLTVDSDLNDQYMLHYMLDTESRNHLLSVKHFTNPFDYKLAITKQNETKTTPIDLIETFNYLIGLHIEKQRTQDGYKCVKGHTLDEKSILIIRRNQAEKDNNNLNSFFEEIRKKIDTNTLDTIYVNGDTMLENTKQKNERRSVKLTEEMFLDKMFSSLS